MSYNITNFTVKELDNLMIPIGGFYKSGMTDWHPDYITGDKNGNSTIENMETTISGRFIDNVMEVTSIDCSGEGSGCVMENMLIPALKESLGTLIAVCVWEGGDSINQLIVNDGKVKWSKIEL